MMKTTARQFSNILIVSLLLAASAIRAQAISIKPGDSLQTERPFDVGMYMGPQWTINLMLIVRRTGRVSITLKHGNNAVLYQENVKKSRGNYWRRFNFEESESGTYAFEISDGQTTVVRRVEVVTIPTIASQRYITYGPQTGL